MTFLEHKTQTRDKTKQNKFCINELQEVDQLKHDINALLNAGFILGCASHDNTRMRQEAWNTVINLQQRYS